MRGGAKGALHREGGHARGLHRALPGLISDSPQNQIYEKIRFFKLYKLKLHS